MDHPQYAAEEQAYHRQPVGPRGIGSRPWHATTRCCIEGSPYSPDVALNCHEPIASIQLEVISELKWYARDRRTPIHYFCGRALENLRRQRCAQTLTPSEF